MKLPHPVALMLALLALLLVLAGGWWATAEKGAPKKIVKVGLYENPPKVHTAANGRPAGLFIELLEAIAARENWQLDYQPCEWQTCLDRLAEGNLDLMPDVAFSVERARRFDFHRISVASSWSQIYAHPALRIMSIEDLSGRRIAVLEGGIQEGQFANLMAGLNYPYHAVRKKSIEQAYIAVLAGEADAVLASTFFAATGGGRYNLAETPIVFQPANLYFATGKGRHADLLARIDTHLDAWRHDSGSLYFDALRRAMAEPPRTIVPPWVWQLVTVLAALLTLLAGISLLLRWQVKVRTTELETERAQIEALVQTIPDLVWVKSPDGTYLKCNAATERFLGRTAAEIIGKKTGDVVDPKSAEFFCEHDRRAVQAGGAHYVYDRLTAADGSKHLFETVKTPVFDKDGTLTGVLGIARDITGRKQIEAELLAAKQRYDELAERIAVGVYTLRTNNDGGIHFEYFSPRFCAMNGLDETAIRKDFMAVLPTVHPDEREAFVRANLEAHGKATHFSWEGRCIIRGEERWMHLESQPTRLDNGDLIWDGVQIDVTERRRAENELALANARLHALSVRLLEIQESERRTLASELHDEIGQSLTALKITLQSLGVRPETAPMQKQIALAIDITDTVLRQVRQMSLDLRPPQLDDLGLPAAIRWNLERQCQLAGLTADFRADDVPAQLPESIAITCYRISQEAVTNVIRHANAKTIRIRLTLAQATLALEIADDGAGMPASSRPSQGMGMASMQERAALAGGRLEILATSPGTLIRATFPLSADYQ